ncbi:MAG: hypothetical protein A2046_10225, partial [Bacteroidetes bacterium GWA2_30_7]
MIKKIANIVSLIFHPLLGPTYGMLFLFNSGSYFSFIPNEAKLIVYLITFIGTFVLPLTFMPFFLYKKIIKNLTLSVRRERVIPLLITALAFYFTYFTISQLPIPTYMNKFFLFSTIIVIISLLITIKWKISNHLVGLGSFTGFVIFTGIKFDLDISNFLIILFLVSGFTASARLYLKAHSNLQVYVGFLTGLFSVILF